MIDITKTILSDSMGDGWSDNNRAADAFAKYLDAIIRKRLWAGGVEGKSYSLDVEVHYNQGGYCDGLDLEAVAEDDDEVDLASYINQILTDIDTIAWTDFCRTEEAAALYE